MEISPNAGGFSIAIVVLKGSDHVFLSCFQRFYHLALPAYAMPFLCLDGC